MQRTPEYGICIGEETGGSFLTYHFDYRGSTVAITDASGSITDTFAYDTYGNLIERSGSSEVIFGYNGRDGVVSDGNGLIYMRARYYSPKFRRFVNADLVAGEITNGITLNCYAYANGNPVSNVDPFGLSAEDRDGSDKFHWFGAALFGKFTEVLVDRIEGMILDLFLVQVFYTETTTKVKKDGTADACFGVYAYTDTHASWEESSAGIGIELFNFIGIDAYVKTIGVGVTASFKLNDNSYYINAEIDLDGDSGISVGRVYELNDSTEVNDQWSLKINNYFILGVIAALLTGQPFFETVQQKV